MGNANEGPAGPGKTDINKVSGSESTLHLLEAYHIPYTMLPARIVCLLVLVLVTAVASASARALIAGALSKASLLNDPVVFMNLNAAESGGPIPRFALITS